MVIKNCSICGDYAEYFENLEIEGPISYRVGTVRCDKCHYSVKKSLETNTKEEIISFWNDKN